jgi:hypothetical protein
MIEGIKFQSRGYLQEELALGKGIPRDVARSRYSLRIDTDAS